MRSAQRSASTRKVLLHLVTLESCIESKKINCILKTNPRTQFVVNPSRFQLQNVKHVLKDFNEKVFASLKLRGCHDIVNFIKTILDWWNIV